MHEPKITFALFKDVLRPQMNGEKLAAEKEENMRTQVIIENFTKNNLDVLVQNYERSVKFLNHRTPKLIFYCRIMNLYTRKLCQPSMIHYPQIVETMKSKMFILTKRTNWMI